MKKQKICILKTCNNKAYYNYKNDTNYIYCKTHKLDNMIDLRNRCKICIYTNCITRANYNYKNENKAIYCKTHKLNNMIDIQNKKCKKDNCNKQPTFNYRTEKNGLYCFTHKLDNMYDIYEIKCINCDKYAYYNYKNEKSPIYCKEHKLNNMIDIKSNRCKKCNIIATYNYQDKNNGIYCKEHKLDNMIDIKHKKCKNTDCNIRANKKYKDYCFNCFIIIFPEHNIIRNYLIKENLVIQFIKNNFIENFVFNKQIQKCNLKYRPDCFLKLNNYIIIIEIDENQHKHNNYNDIYRNNNIYNQLNIPLIVIRFNPDSYINNQGKKKLSSFLVDKNTNKLKIRNENEWSNRLEILKINIKKYINYQPNKNIKDIKLFYDYFNY